MIIAYYCCRGSAEEHPSRIGEFCNSVLDFLLGIVEYFCPDLRELLDGWLGRLPVSQCSYLDFDPNINSHKIIFKKIVQRGTMTPYEFKFYDPAHIIAGIACAPQDDKTSSPEVEVVDGGISCHHVVIRLSPVQKGPWACSIEISGTEESSVQMV
jgi:hypothetical protein